MNFFGIGPAELILIFILTFVVAGPKRMVQWAYYLGRYMAQFRRMTEEAWSQVRKELESAQIHLPEAFPRHRVNLVQEVNRAINAELSRAMSPAASRHNPEAPNGVQPDSAEPAADSAPDLGRSEDTKRYDAWLPK